MSDNIQSTEFDLEKMFLPDWAVKPPTTGQYTKYADEEVEKKPQRTRESAFRRRGQRQEGAALRDREDRQRRDRERGRHRRKRQEFIPLPKVKVSIILNDDTVNKTIRQIKMIGRAFPLFELARRALDYPKNQLVKFDVVKNKDGSVVQPLFLCLLDNTLWLSEAEAIDYVLDKHFSTFYQAERTQIEPPKGKYTFVAQCGLSGVILGPPNHHDYQLKLRKLHAERFSHIPFDQYKMKIRIVKDEEVVKKWIEEQSWRTEYITLNVPEPIRLVTRDEVVQHFRQTHLPNIIQQVESFILEGESSRNIPCKPLQRLVRKHWEEEKRFPMRLAVFLSQKFAEQGLQFFKWDRRITYVAVSRPHYLDLESTPVSENVKRIIDYIRNHPGCNRYEILEALAPSPKREIPIAPQTSSSIESQTAESASAPQETAPQTAETDTANVSAEQTNEQTQVEEFTPEQTAILADIHWLIHQGHIIEFYTGKIYVAKKPRPRPVKEQKQKETTEAQKQGQAETATAAEPVSTAETTAEPSAVSGEAQGQETQDSEVAEPVDLEQLQKDTFEGEELAETNTELSEEDTEGDEEKQSPIASEENKSLEQNKEDINAKQNI